MRDKLTRVMEWAAFTLIAGVVMVDLVAFVMPLFHSWGLLTRVLSA